MTCRVLVVEDEIFVAIEIESVVAELGLEPIGIASDKATALSLAGETDLAFVDLNLLDGLTGPEIGRTLAERGVTVMFMTANPSQLGTGIAGTLGVLPKPVSDVELREAVVFAVKKHHAVEEQPPARLQLFAGAVTN